jgi:PAS domain S-box-containing protein
MTKALARLSADFAHRTNVLVALACGALATGIFLIDVASLPLGVAAGVAYVAVVLISLYLPRWQYSIFIAGVVSILTMLGFFMSERAGVPWMVIANRLLALVAIWLTAIGGSWLVHSRRKKSEEALRMQKSFSDTLFEKTPAVVLHLDPTGKITGINPYLEQVSGYSAKEVLGKYWFEIFAAEDEQCAIRERLREVSGKLIDTSTPITIVTKDGQQRQIEWRGTTLSDATGKLVGYLNVGHDVTYRLQHKQALQKVEQEASRARNAKSRFVETASNDLRHHLQTLSLIQGALRRIIANPEAQEMFAMQGDALDHLREHLDSLLEISRLDAGDVELEINETPVLEIMQRLQEEFEPEAKAKGLKLQFDSQAEVVYSDRKLLTQIVRRMLSNAIRYTHSGNVKIHCRRETGGLRVTVQDSGIGIAPDQLAVIFDEFYQVEKDPGRRNVGLGLGLSIAERGANLLGTKVEVESEVGRGSSFSLVLPAVITGEHLPSHFQPA